MLVSINKGALLSERPYLVFKTATGYTAFAPARHCAPHQDYLGYLDRFAVTATVLNIRTLDHYIRMYCNYRIPRRTPK